MTDDSLAYIAGVLHGDAYSSTKFGLTAIDKDFVQAFAQAGASALGLTWRVRPTRGRYWCVETSNKTGRFSHLRHIEPKTLKEKAMWVRGWFDAEGSAYCADGVGERGYTFRKVCGVSTAMPTIEKVASYLTDLGIKTRVLSRNKPSEGHIGTRIVHEVALRGRKDFELFRDLVGSSIARKRETLDKIVASYLSDEEFQRRFMDARRRGGRKKAERTVNVTLPAVVAGIRKLIADGVKPTQRNCRSIPGYNTIQPQYAQRKLIEMAGQ